MLAVLLLLPLVPDEEAAEVRHQDDGGQPQMHRLH